jgi:hypothetical protein
MRRINNIRLNTEGRGRDKYTENFKGTAQVCLHVSKVS